MPKKEIDYSKTVIYKIVCNDLNVKDVYVGHTTDFTKRKTTHKSHCLKEKDKKHNLKVYKTIRAHGGWDNWTMIEIEKYPCSDKNEACSRERYFYEILNANLNMICPTFNFEQHKDNVKKYKKVHMEEIVEYVKKWNVNNDCECGGTYTSKHKARHLKSIKHIEYMERKDIKL